MNVARLGGHVHGGLCPDRGWTQPSKSSAQPSSLHFVAVVLVPTLANADGVCSRIRSEAGWDFTA